MSITPNLMSDLLGRLPNFELSYETISHKKVSTDYNITLAVPYGKKAYIWFTFLRDKDVCLLLEIGREKKVTSMKLLSDVNIPRHLAYGTILYGSVCETPDVGQCFVFEDIFYSKGVSIAKQPFGEKLGFLYELFTCFPDCFSQNKSLPIVMPVCWPLISDFNSNVPDDIQSQYSITNTVYCPPYSTSRTACDCTIYKYSVYAKYSFVHEADCEYNQPAIIYSSKFASI